MGGSPYNKTSDFFLLLTDPFRAYYGKALRI